jgi:hypothetical protein
MSCGSSSPKIIQDSIDTVNRQIALYEGQKISEIKKKDAQLNIQIIPNVKRIKLEKVAVAHELHMNLQGQSPELQFNEDLSVHHSVDLEKLESMTHYSYYYENVFSLEDLYLFRAVYHFYLGDYEAALADFGHCQ